MYSGKAVKSSSLVCCYCHGRFPEATLANAVTLAIRTWTAKYYNSPLQVRGRHNGRILKTQDISVTGGLESRTFDEKWMYSQLRYLQFLMDVPSRWELIPGHEEFSIIVSRVDLAVYERFLAQVNKSLDANRYKVINLYTFLAPLGL